MGNSTNRSNTRHNASKQSPDGSFTTSTTQVPSSKHSSDASFTISTTQIFDGDDNQIPPRYLSHDIIRCCGELNLRDTITVVETSQYTQLNTLFKCTKCGRKSTITNKLTKL